MRAKAPRRSASDRCAGPGGAHHAQDRAAGGGGDGLLLEERGVCGAAGRHMHGMSAAATAMSTTVTVMVMGTVTVTVRDADERTHHKHGGHAHSSAQGIEWEDDMVEVNRLTTPANMRWKLVDQETGAENAQIDWTFRVGDHVKLRLINEMDSDHPMPHPFHVHGAGCFLILARDGVVEPNLAWKDTVLVRTDETRRHPARCHEPRALDGPLSHRRAPRERDDVAST
jgi:FtsP/CotA-like multicopper oxidase with cupredoxin domain